MLFNVRVAFELVFEGIISESSFLPFSSPLRRLRCPVEQLHRWHEANARLFDLLVKKFGSRSEFMRIPSEINLSARGAAPSQPGAAGRAHLELPGKRRITSHESIV